MRTRLKLKYTIATTAIILLNACGGSGSPAPIAVAPPPPPPPSEALGPEACVNGMAGEYPCNGVSLSKRIPLSDFSAASGNDIWGWTDPSDGTEYALMGLDNGTAFVRISDPDNPVIVGKLPTETTASVWRDIKVYNDHAFIVADAAGAHGMQIFDLTRLRGQTGNQTFAADTVYSQVDNTHNVAINEDSGFAYLVGSNTCGGGFHVVDISDPVNPAFSTCHSASGESHDTQCINYAGPDADYAGAEICFGANEDRFAVVDMTDKSNTVAVASITYPNLGYVHQNWIDDSHRYVLVGDEIDERDLRLRTSTIVIDVTDLDDPQYLYTHQANQNSIDHNMYIVGNNVYQANYHSGLRVLEFTDLATDTLTETIFFDTFPDDNETGFDGAWSVYPFLNSGTVIVSDTDRGLFILTPD